MTQQKVPHKHAAIIKQWADGAAIQIKMPDGWKDVDGIPWWSTQCNYRVKPEPKPDVVMYCCIDKKQYNNGHPYASVSWVTNANPDLLKTDNVMFIFDGETGALKSAQVLAHV